MPSLVGDVYGRWFKFLSRWALFAGLVNVGLFLFYGLWFVPASQGSPLSPQYDELSAAISAPVLHRFAIAFDVAAWLVLGVFIIALAAVLTRRTPIRSVFIAACSIGAVAGLIGAFVRLDGVGNLAARYEAAAPDQQEALLRSYLDLQLVINSGFTAGGLLWGRVCARGVGGLESGGVPALAGGPDRRAGHTKCGGERLLDGDG